MEQESKISPIEAGDSATGKVEFDGHSILLSLKRDRIEPSKKLIDAIGTSLETVAKFSRLEDREKVKRIIEEYNGLDHDIHQRLQAIEKILFEKE